MEINGKSETNNKNNNDGIDINNIIETVPPVIMDKKLNIKTNELINNTVNTCNKISNEILIISSSDDEDFSNNDNNINNKNKFVKINILKRKRVTDQTEELKSKRKQFAKLTIKDFYENTKADKKKIITEGIYTYTHTLLNLKTILKYIYLPYH